jgi:phosphoglycolate phosphatase
MEKLIIFDFDGTISNSLDIAYKVYEALSEKYGFKRFTKEEINEFKALSIQERFKRHHISIFKLPKLARKTRNIISDLMHETNPFPEMPELLKELKDKGYKLAIVSSNSKKNILEFLKVHQMISFDHIYGKASFFGKERLMKKALKKFKNHDSIYVGDELRDIVSSKSVGLKIASVSWGFDDRILLEGAEPDYILDNVSSLREVLLNY